MNPLFEEPKQTKVKEEVEKVEKVEKTIKRLGKLTQLLRLAMVGVYVATTIPANAGGFEKNNRPQKEERADDYLVNNYIEELVKHKGLYYRKPGEVKKYNDKGEVENADCSDLVNMALELPYKVNSDELCRRYTKKIDPETAQKGDLIFWKTKKGRAYHVATILEVLDDGKFITFEITSDEPRYEGDAPANISGERTRKLKKNREIKRINFNQVRFAKQTYQK
ncbi:MAG: hypothetical protein GF335_03620, partial [Candidatus Moranbacteria bacterium]|nr:hypothetical protein [Candidatus Moranbacteria bacterium]